MEAIEELEQRQMEIEKKIQDFYLVKTSLSKRDYRKHSNINDVNMLSNELMEIKTAIERIKSVNNSISYELRGGCGNKVLYSCTPILHQVDENTVEIKTQTERICEIKSNEDTLGSYIKHLEQSREEVIKKPDSNTISYKLQIKKKIKQHIILTAMNFANGEQYDILVNALIKTVKLEEEDGKGL